MSFLPGAWSRECVLYETAESVCGSVSLSSQLLLEKPSCTSHTEEDITSALVEVFKTGAQGEWKCSDDCACPLDSKDGNCDFVLPRDKCGHKANPAKCAAFFMQKIEQLQKDEKKQSSNTMLEIRDFADPTFWLIRDKSKTDKARLNPKVLKAGYHEQVEEEEVDPDDLEFELEEHTDEDDFETMYRKLLPVSKAARKKAQDNGILG